MFSELPLITFYLLILSSFVVQNTKDGQNYSPKTSANICKYHPLTFIANTPLHKSKDIHHRLTCVKAKKFTSTVKPSPFLPALLMIGGIETNPGPVKYPCGVCHKPCKSNQRAIACNDCDQWCHAKCMGISDKSYQQLGVKSTSWYCTNCNSHNHSTVLYAVPLSNDTYSPLSDNTNISFISESSSIGNPLHTSSPKVTKTSGTATQHRKGLRTVIVNFQSIRNKTAELEVLVDTTTQDAIIGTETWFNKSTLSSEFFPDTYTVYRRDRGTDSHGGVLIAVQTSLTSSEIFSSKSVELIAVKADLPGGKQLIVSSFYRSKALVKVTWTVFAKTLLPLNNKYNKAVFYIGGDFNTPDIDWSTYTVNGSIYPKNTPVRLLSKLENTWGLSRWYHATPEEITH